jgi:adenylate cyclase
MVQGYLSSDPSRSVRVRLAGEEAWITIKGRAVLTARAEFEYSIPVEDARELLELCLPSLIEKTRHRIQFGAFVWEVDVFHGANEGLVMAEVELADEADEPEIPPWVGVEVTGDKRYCNSSLAQVPYSQFRGKLRNSEVPT